MHAVSRQRLPTKTLALPIVVEGTFTLFFFTFLGLSFSFHEMGVMIPRDSVRINETISLRPSGARTGSGAC